MDHLQFTLDPRLISHLEDTYPDRCPEMSMSDREIWMSAGKASVVRYLKTLLEEQQERASDSTHVFR